MRSIRQVSPLPALVGRNDGSQDGSQVCDDRGNQDQIRDHNLAQYFGKYLNNFLSLFDIQDFRRKNSQANRVKDDLPHFGYGSATQS